MFRFHKTYFFIALLLFIVEVYIALFIKDDFIRPYLGDVLVVILIYTFIMAFYKISYVKLALGVLLFAFFIEWLQYLNFVEAIGLKNSKLANIVIGNSFEPMDLLAYAAGIIVLLFIEKIRRILIT